MNNYPKDVASLPNEPFLAILKPKSTHIPGDERSRTNPGHGYSAHSVASWDIEVFPNEEEWVAEIEMLKKSRFFKKEFKAVRITPAKIKVNVTVDIEELKPSKETEE